jgi:hypothetical protein
VTPQHVPGINDDDFSEESSPDDVVDDADVVQGPDGDVPVEPAEGSSESAEDFEGAADREMERRRRKEEQGDDLEQHWEQRADRPQGKTRKRKRRPRNPAATARLAPSDEWPRRVETAEEILRKVRDHQGEVMPWPDAEEILRPLRASFRESESAEVRRQRTWNRNLLAEDERKRELEREKAERYREVERMLEPGIAAYLKKAKHGRRGGTGRKASGTRALRTRHQDAPLAERFQFTEQANDDEACREWLCARLEQRGDRRFIVGQGEYAIEDYDPALKQGRRSKDADQLRSELARRVAELEAMGANQSAVATALRRNRSIVSRLMREGAKWNF